MLVPSCLIVFYPFVGIKCHWATGTPYRVFKLPSDKYYWYHRDCSFIDTLPF
jgi:hypothetical protein